MSSWWWRLHPVWWVIPRYNLNQFWDVWLSSDQIHDSMIPLSFGLNFTYRIPDVSKQKLYLLVGCFVLGVELNLPKEATQTPIKTGFCWTLQKKATISSNQNSVINGFQVFHPWNLPIAGHPSWDALWSSEQFIRINKESFPIQKC